MKTNIKQKKEVLVVAIVLMFLILLLVFSNLTKLLSLFKVNSNADNAYSKNALIEEQLAKKKENKDENTKKNVETKEVLKVAKVEEEDKTGDTLEVKSTANFASQAKKNGRLAAPSYVKLNGKKLEFNKVSNALSYIIKIDNLNEKTSKEISTIQTTLDVSKYLNENCIYNISVKAISSNVMTYKDSYYTSKIELDNRGILAVPSNVRMEKNILKFNSVTNASYYEIYVTNLATGISKKHTVESNSFKINISELSSAMYKIRVKAIASLTERKFKDSQLSEKCLLDNRIKLSKVTNIKVSDGKLIFDKVKYTDKYTVILMDVLSGKATTINTDTNNVALYSYDSKYNVRIISRTSNCNMYSDSEESDVCEIDLRNSISCTDNILYNEEQKKIVWNEVVNAEGYNVQITTIKGEKADIYNEYTKNASLDLNKFDYDRIQVRISTVAGISALKDSCYTNTAFFPYVEDVQLINPDMDNDIHYVVIKMKNKDVSLENMQIEEDVDLNKKIEKDKIIKVEGKDDEYKVPFEELSKLNPGMYTLKISYKTNTADILRYIVRNVNVKQAIRIDVKTESDTTSNVIYNITDNTKVATEDASAVITENPNKGSYKITAIDEKNPSNVLEDTIETTATNVKYNLTEAISKNNLPAGTYNVVIEPVEAKEGYVINTKLSRFSESVVIGNYVAVPV